MSRFNDTVIDMDGYDRDLSYSDMDDDLGGLHLDIDGNVRDGRDPPDLRDDRYPPADTTPPALDRDRRPVVPTGANPASDGAAERRPLPKLTAFMPSKFAGKSDEDPEEHFAAFLDYLREQGIKSEEEAVYRFRFTLQGRASSWYRNKIFNSLRDLRTKFVRCFVDSFSRESDAALFRAVKLKSNETLDEFYGRLKSLGRRLRYSEQVILDTFLGELPPDMQDTLSHLRRRDPDIDLVEEAQLLYHRHRHAPRPLVESIHLASTQPQVQAPNANQELLVSLCEQMSNLAAEQKNQGTSSFQVPENEAHHSRGSGRGRGRYRSPGPRRTPQQNWGQSSGEYYPNNQERQGPPSARRGYPPNRGRGQGRPHASRPNSFRNIQCYVCFGWGHISSQCPSQPADSGPGPRGQQPMYGNHYDGPYHNRQHQNFH